MVKAVGIQFRPVGKIYRFAPSGFECEVGDKVIVETGRGIEMGTVVVPFMDIIEQGETPELKQIMRRATERDLIDVEENTKEASLAIPLIKEISVEHNLEMKIIDCEFTLDRSKLTIYYTADGRVDFRDLVKDLAREFRVRIEMRQIGARDGAKIIGGIGNCGRTACCATYLREFDYVTMKEAKDQSLNLSGSKAMGLCGKLMCCINFESELYKTKRAKLPKIGDYVATANCSCGVVTSINYLSEVLKIETPDGNQGFEITADQTFVLTEEAAQAAIAAGIKYTQVAKERAELDFGEPEAEEPPFKRERSAKRVPQEPKRPEQPKQTKARSAKPRPKRENRRSRKRGSDVVVTTVVDPRKK